MCIEKLVCKEKVMCLITGLHGEITFSGVGFMSEPIQFIAILVKTSGIYTIELEGQRITKQGKGIPEFCIISQMNLISPNIYSMTYTSSEQMTIYELNFATRCLCNIDEC